MFGIGPQELIIIGILFLLIFGPSKLSDTARDIGRFTNEARRTADEFKAELTSVTEEVNETRRAVVDELKSELDSELDSDSGRDDSGRRASRDAGRPPQGSHTEEQTNDTGERE